MLSQDILNAAMLLMFGVVIALIGVLQVLQVLSCASWTFAVLNIVFPEPSIPFSRPYVLLQIPII